MKAISLLLLRITTGTLLILWGSLRVRVPEQGAGLADKYYQGILNDASIQPILGYGEIALGVLVILGLLRFIVYPIQALVLGFGAVMIWKHILDPFGMYLQESSNLLFFPSSTVFFASLVLLAFRDHDTLSIDGLRR